jgi:hypothetical protein
MALGNSKISADNILFTFAMFMIISIAYGQTLQAADVQTNMSTLFAGWPTFQQVVASLTPSSTKCAAWDFGCQASQGVAQATGFLGAVLAYPSILGGSILSRVSAFGNLMALVTFGPASSLASIPFGALFLFGLALIVVIEVFRWARGSPTGL